MRTSLAALALSLVVLFSLASSSLQAQVGIGTTSPNQGAILDLTAPDKALLLPRLESGAFPIVTTPEEGMMAWNFSDGEYFYYDGSTWGPLVPLKSVVATNPIQGDGTSATPLQLRAGDFTGDLMFWTGTEWNHSQLATSARIEGNGYGANALDIAQMGANTGDILHWDGNAWAPVTPAGGLSFFTESEYTGTIPAAVWEPTNAAVSVGVVLGIKGNGFFALEEPDNTVTGGNVRG